ncbi:MAG: carboxypeptidase-like regulatory domain-containing protein [Flavobacterium sp.]|nr:carboxypeptidase-like regulatory domain-containing protein [Flavobacterium sp.]
MRFKLHISLLLLPFFVLAQTPVKGIVVDEDGNPVPYVNIWVANENSGATASAEGVFLINATDGNKLLVFSAVGFETKKIAAAAAEKVILKRAIFALEEVVLQKPTGKNPLIIDAYKKSDVNLNYGCGNRTPWMLAKFFAYNDSLSATPFLNRLTIMTESFKNNVTFNFRLLEVNDDGSPGKDLTTENIIVNVKRSGKKNTDVDLTPYRLNFPEKGFFVSVEFLIIESNKTIFQMKGSKEKTDGWDPSFGALPSEKALTWKYSGGKWVKMGKRNEKVPPDYFDKFANLAIQLTLTN